MKDNIYNLMPIDKQASVIVSKQEYEYGFTHKTQCIRSLSPLPTEQIKVRKQESGIIGSRFGMLTVIGAFPLMNRNKNRKWVVKCDCGYYETRYLRTLKNNSVEMLCCTSCQKSYILTHKKHTDTEFKHLKKMDKNHYFKTRNSFKKFASVGDYCIGKNGVIDRVEYVSKGNLKFVKNNFKQGDYVKNITKKK